MRSTAQVLATVFFLVVAVASVVHHFAPTEPSEAAPGEPVSTFSILGYDPDTGEIGAAVQSRVFSVGNGVIWAEAGIGAIATQAVVDVGYGPLGLQLLGLGVAPEEVGTRLLAADQDPRPADWPKTGRQFAVLDKQGRAFAHTGVTAPESCAHQIGEYCTAQGNLLASEEVVKAMTATFEETEGHISLRLMAALDAAQEAGGDRRGMQSAAMIVVKKDGGPWLHNDVVLRLQVDDNPQPLAELRRLVEKAAEQRKRFAK